MERLGVVEVLGRKGAVLRRTPVGRSFTIGRGYRCDVMLEDPFVEETHVRVEAAGDGGFVATDLGGVNPVTVGGAPLGKEPRALAAGARLTVGQTTLRLMSATAAVEPALPLSEARDGGIRPSRAWGLAIAAIALLTVLDWSATPTEYDAANALQMGSGGLVAFAAWCGAWAVGTRLFKDAFRFHAHLGAVSLALLVAVPASWIAGLIAFALGPSVQVIVGVVTAAATFTLILYLHARVSSSASRRRLGLISAGVTLLFAGLAFAVTAGVEDPAGSISASLGSLEPVPNGIVLSGSPEEFDDAIAELVEELESLEP